MTKTLDKRTLCPACGTTETMPFADENIDSKKIGEFSYASRKTPEFMNYRLVRCCHCNLVYVQEPPQAETLHSAYEKAAYDSSAEAGFAAKTYTRLLSSHITSLNEKLIAVDVGAGNGALLPHLEKLGFPKVIGIEPSRAAIDAAPDTVRSMLREGMFSSEILEGLKPSLICSFMTLEHLADPMEFCRIAEDALTPGGMLAIVVHNWKAPLNRLLGMKSPIIDIEHLQLFCPQSVTRMLEKSQFRQITVQSFSNTYPFYYCIRLAPFPDVIKRSLTAFSTAIQLAKLPIPVPAGNLFVTARKTDYK